MANHASTKSPSYFVKSVLYMPQVIWLMICVLLLGVLVSMPMVSAAQSQVNGVLIVEEKANDFQLKAFDKGNFNEDEKFSKGPSIYSVPPLPDSSFPEKQRRDDTFRNDDRQKIFSDIGMKQKVLLVVACIVFLAGVMIGLFNLISRVKADTENGPAPRQGQIFPSQSNRRMSHEQENQQLRGQVAALSKRCRQLECELELERNRNKQT